MFISDLLKNWESNESLPEGDFRDLLTAINEIIEPQDLADDYDAVCHGLLELIIQIQESVGEIGDWVIDDKKISWTGRGALDRGVLTIETETLAIPISLSGLVSGSDADYQGQVANTTQGDLLSSVTEIIAKFNDKGRYAKGGATQLMIDWLWWGFQCWWTNGDTIGEGDQTFGVYQQLYSNEYTVWFDHDYSKIPEIPNYYPINQDDDDDDYYDDADDDETDFPSDNLNNTLVPAQDDNETVKFSGLQDDFIGDTEYAPNGEPDALFIASIGLTGIEEPVTITKAWFKNNNTTWSTAGDKPLGIIKIRNNKASGKLLNLPVKVNPSQSIGFLIDSKLLTNGEQLTYSIETEEYEDLTGTVKASFW